MLLLRPIAVKKSMCVSNRSTISGFFLAGRFMFWLPVGASLFASNIGSEHFIGLAGSGAASGISVGAFELNALAIIQLTGWVFLPVFIASRVCTLPEYMSKRFGGLRIRTYLAVLSLVLYVFTKISVNLFSGAVFINQALQWDLYVAILGLLLMTGICTVTGGLAAVIYTDTLQFFVMITGAAIVAVKAFIQVGGISGLQEKYMQAIPSQRIHGTDCGIPKEDAWMILRSWDDPDMPWLGFLIGQTPASIWYWCTDQMMVQRLLAAKSLSHAQGGTLFAGFMKILPIFLIVMPGMISRVLFTDEVACVDPEVCMAYCQNPAGCSNVAYPRLVLELMPTGLRGLMMAVMLAALMSDLTSVYNSASTLFTMDIWPQIRKEATVWELMIVGRTFIILMILISIGWIPIIQNLQGGQLFIYIQSVSAYLAPPIAAVYILAVLWKRMNEQGCFWAMMLGFLVGVTRMVLDFIYRQPACNEIDTRPVIIQKVHYMYFACILFCITVISAVIISLMTEPPEEFRLVRTTYWTRFEEGDRDDDKDNFEMRRNVDLQEKVCLNDMSQEEAGDIDAEEAQVPGVIEEKTAVFYLKKLGNWFCGFNQNTQDKNEEVFQHLTEIASLRQSKRDKIILNTLLVIALAIPVFTYAYFSVAIKKLEY
ncbi:sodium/myo-inositol cotransporter 2-like isoform X1 [Stegodyphus dumicola]|uniref:sodium/myo-inositol cotransporter 2-like isoform X1 n=1 Tax=Stegodyphus dumicola TaxID=202533 RepID=UPI0015AAE364|nr:sodium/myo-inositol cotransporter 2-like isoform X1 [Stegodyphus dumicola]